MKFLIVVNKSSAFALYHIEADDIIQAIKSWYLKRNPDFWSAENIKKILQRDFVYDDCIDEPVLIESTTNAWYSSGPNMLFEINFIGKPNNIHNNTYIFLYEGGTYLEQNTDSQSMTDFVFGGNFEKHLKSITCIDLPAKEIIADFTAASSLGSKQLGGFHVEFMFTMNHDFKSPALGGPVLIKIST